MNSEKKNGWTQKQKKKTKKKTDEPKKTSEEVLLIFRALTNVNVFQQDQNKSLI